jgi:hypothetical protein
LVLVALIPLPMVFPMSLEIAGVGWVAPGIFKKHDISQNQVIICFPEEIGAQLRWRYSRNHPCLFRP